MKHPNYLSFEQGDIIVLPVPFSDLSSSKLRPALVISDNLFNKAYPDLILLKITSIGHLLPFDVKLAKNDLVEGELIKSSTINCGFLLTAHKNIVVRKIGKISDIKLNEVKEKLKMLFNI